MSDATIPEFITKKEVEQRFGRSHRSLTRDVSKAIRVGDVDLLQHLKLRTEDNTVREGADVTLELVQELSNRGLTPTWYVRQSWAEERYGSRSKDRARQPSPAKEVMQDPAPAISSGRDNEVVVILKEQLRRSQEEHQKDKEAFREQTKMFKEMFDTLKDDHADTKNLLKEVHNVFGNLSQGILTRGQGSNGFPVPFVAKKPDIDEPSADIVTVTQSDTEATKKTQQQKQPATPKTKVATAKRKVAARQASNKSVEVQPTWVDKHLPTLKRFFSR